MKKILIIGTMAIALAGCQTVAQDRALTGAAIGGLAGTVIGAAATGTGGGALAGAAIGAGTGALIGAATAPQGPCYVRGRNGRMVPVTC